MASVFLLWWLINKQTGGLFTDTSSESLKWFWGDNTGNMRGNCEAEDERNQVSDRQYKTRQGHAVVIVVRNYSSSLCGNQSLRNRALIHCNINKQSTAETLMNFLNWICLCCSSLTSESRRRVCGLSAEVSFNYLSADKLQLLLTGGWGRNEAGCGRCCQSELLGGNAARYRPKPSCFLHLKLESDGNTEPLQESLTATCWCNSWWN